MNADKELVRDFWDKASCGELLYLPQSDREGYEAQARMRENLEPYIAGFADFGGARGLRVLEVGVGLGADHQRFAESGAELCGVDLTLRAVEHTRRRLAAFGLKSQIDVGDAEDLRFPDESFDRVYSWGVLHHSPDTKRAVEEVRRVLRRGGEARIMIYHKWSLVGLMLWTRYGLLQLRPWRSLAEIYAAHLESPGTKAYTVAEARAMFAAFANVHIHTVLTHGDLLESGAGQRHSGPLLSIARRVWPRWLLRRIVPGMGLFMLIVATKP
jgi:ubiquinone/menaquinone biosynthesis C-methylase UbiE